MPCKYEQQWKKDTEWQGPNGIHKTKAQILLNLLRLYREESSTSNDKTSRFGCYLAVDRLLELYAPVKHTFSLFPDYFPYCFPSDREFQNEFRREFEDQFYEFQPVFTTEYILAIFKRVFKKTYGIEPVIDVNDDLQRILTLTRSSLVEINFAQTVREYKTGISGHQPT